MFARILVGKYQGMYARVTVGELDEDKLVYPKDSVCELIESDLAKDLIDLMMQSSMGSMEWQDKLLQFVRSEDASYLVSKYLGNINIPNIKGGCCG